MFLVILLEVVKAMTYNQMAKTVCSTVWSLYTDFNTLDMNIIMAETSLCDVQTFYQK